MENPRPEKVAVVEEVRSRLGDATGAILTEYRGLTVTEMAELRHALERAGGDYKVYKNTLVKLATTGGRHEALHTLLEGPTGIAFVTGEISAVAKALRDYSRANPHLIVKGGMFGDDVLSSSDLTALADLPPRDVLLARFAGALAAPLQQMAGLLQALPRNFAYGLSALIGERPVEADVPPAEASAPAVPAAEASAPEVPAAEAPSDAATEEVPATVAAAETEAAAATEPATEEATATEAAAETEAAAAEETEVTAGAADATTDSASDATTDSASDASASDASASDASDSTDTTTESTTDDKTDESKEQNGNG
ncbi:MAG: 50S ribosomal protein L10 [Acidimicrobiales bacterium]